MLLRCRQRALLRPRPRMTVTAPFNARLAQVQHVVFWGYCGGLLTDSLLEGDSILLHYMGFKAG